MLAVSTGERMSKLRTDRVAKGTRIELQVLLRRCLELQAHDVRIPRYGILALQRVIAYLAANDVEGLLR